MCPIYRGYSFIDRAFINKLIDDTCAQVFVTMNYVTLFYYLFYFSRECAIVRNVHGI